MRAASSSIPLWETHRDPFQLEDERPPVQIRPICIYIDQSRADEWTRRRSVSCGLLCTVLSTVSLLVPFDNAPRFGSIADLEAAQAWLAIPSDCIAG